MKANLFRSTPVLVAVGLAGCLFGDWVPGERFDAERECWGGSKEFWSSDAPGCDQARTYTKDGNGTIWRFRNSCVADDMEVVSFLDNGFPDCPAAGVDLIDAEYRVVDIENQCLEPSTACGFRKAADDPCWDDSPLVKDATNGVWLMENTCCEFKYTESRYISVEKALALPDCAEVE